MFERKNLILIGLVGIILGFFVAQQFYLHKKITETIQPENEKNLALEVTELIKTNRDLEKEVEDLNDQHNKLVESADDVKTANVTLEENLTKYEIVLGLSEVYGEGVELVFDSKVSSTQLIDLLNAIKNIGADAIQINDARVVPTTSITGGFFDPPLKIKIIGEKRLLSESLTRKGGILEQIGYGKVTELDEVSIKKN